MAKLGLTIYETEIDRELMILSYLYTVEEFVPIKKISEDTEMTQASVRKYIERIQLIVKELGEEGIGVSCSEQGVQFYAQSIQQYYHIRNSIIHSSITIQLAITLLLGEPLQREKIMMTRFISEATLKRRIKELKSFFLEHHMNIHFQNGDLTLKGDELQIRKLAYEVLIELYIEGSWPFETIDENVVTSRIEVYLGMRETPETANLFRSVKLDYGIMISRFRNKRSLKVKFTEISPELRQAMVSIIPKLSPFPEIPIDHALYFVITLLANEDFFKTPKGQIAMVLIEESGSDIAALVDYSSQEFCHFFNIDVDPSQLKPFLYSLHFFKFFYRYWRGVAKKKKIAMPYPMLNRKLFEYARHLQESYPGVLKNPFYWFIRNYIVLYGRYKPCSDFELPINIHLSDTDFPSQSQLLMNIFQQMFLYRYHLKFSSLEEADIIIRTTLESPSPRLAIQEGDVLTCYMNVSKIYQNYEYLNTALEKIAYKKILAYNKLVYSQNKKNDK